MSARVPVTCPIDRHSQPSRRRWLTTGCPAKVVQVQTRDADRSDGGVPVDPLVEVWGIATLRQTCKLPCCPWSGRYRRAMQWSENRAAIKSFVRMPPRERLKILGEARRGRLPSDPDSRQRLEGWARAYLPMGYFVATAWIVCFASSFILADPAHHRVFFAVIFGVGAIPSILNCFTAARVRRLASRSPMR